MRPAHRFGKYEVLEEVGQGGMSVVYRGRDTVLGREVAIKVMHPFLATKKEAKERFYREARTVARLHHPNVLEIFDYSGEDAEQAYIVTEFIRGETLSSFIGRHQPQLPEMGLLLIRPICEALTHAHESGIIHRDLKPENVMIRQGGTVKLMDFGIAQMIDADTLTMTGALLGSPAHMSPELIDGLQCDARSDIFSLGTILYWLMTSRLPFTAPTAPALFKKIVDGAFDDPRIHNPLITQRMVDLLMRFMKRKREERFQSIVEAEQAVDVELTKLGLSNPTEWLTRYLKDTQPKDTELALRAAALGHSKRRGDEAVQQKDLAAALEAFDRVLLLDPNDHEVRQKVLALSRRKAQRQRLEQVLMYTQALMLMLAAVSTGISVHGYWSRSQEVGGAPSLNSPLRAPTFTRRILEPARAAVAPEPAAPNGASSASTANPKPTPPTDLPPRDVEFSVFPFGSLYIDNELVSDDMLKPLTKTLAVGRHDIRAENPFREPVTKSIDVPEKGDIAPVRLRLEAWKPAGLVVRTEGGAELVIDGAAKGAAAQTEQTPIRIPMLSGERTIEIKVVKAGRADKTEKVIVKAGQTKEVTATW